jgi:hypothetical protein
MITQYDALAEIEAMKVARSRTAVKTAAPAAASVSSWLNASEQAIRAEMERRLVRRGTAAGSSESLD